jgi:uncharacterized protein YfaS (alpha-2-macroglobulin family)
MKTFLWGTLLTAMSFSLLGGPRDAEWKKVEQAIKQGLPKTAITNLEPIIHAALKEKAYAEATKAVGLRIALEGNIQGNKPEERITRLEAEIVKAPKEMTPVLQTLLAHWYWEYYQQNRWRFLQRTATSQAPGNDFTTWDLPRLFAEIERQFQNALAAENVLKATPVQAWDDLLQKGTLPDRYRPTLYDFIAHEALDFYTSGEQGGARPEDTIDFLANQPVYGSVPLFGTGEEFAGAKIERRNNAAPIERALFLFRDLINFHRGDKDPSAYAAVDLERLVWAHNVAVGEDKDSRYKASLKAFVDRWADHEVSALALHYWALVLQQEDDLVEAHHLAQRGAQIFPQSPGGKLCRNLITEIESKSASISTERVWNEPWPKLEVNYRNVEAVYLRAIPYKWEVFLEKNHRRPEALSDQEKRAVLATKPGLEWSEKLPPTSDYKARTFHSAPPRKLEPGFYFIAASHDPGFNQKGNIVSLADVWVSDLALVTRTRSGFIEGFVLQANSGEPIAGAEVSVWHLDNTGNRIADSTLHTDENGFFSMKATSNRGYLLRARHQSQELATAADLWAYDAGVDQRLRPTAQTFFFTDRAIYRPGQIIQYKGICLSSDQTKDNYDVLKGEDLTVVFRDVNGKEIARHQHRANDYGSFAGSFTAPRDGLLGQMHIETLGRATGSAYLRVEEYKRPKFEVTLDAPKTAAKLNEKVTLFGHATSYTGAAVDGAQVKYRVVRQVRMPWWWGWYSRGALQGESQEITHGHARTETDGSFKIEFTARPDLKVPETDEPTFIFQVNADITDAAGETRSAERTVRVGYTALEATLTANEWQIDDQAVELKLQTKSLDDEPQIAEGNVKIYELQAPPTVERPPLAEQRYRPMSQPTTQAADDDLSNPNNWPLGRVVAETGFTTESNGLANLSFKLGPGSYRAVLETQDHFGKKVKGKLPLQVLRPTDTRLGIKIPSLIAAPKWVLQPGEDFMALWGTGYDDGRALIEIERRQQMLQRYWTRPGQTQQQIKLAITDALRGGFTLHVTQVRENRAYLQSRRVDVPWKNKELEITWEHFTSKLQPGQKETWTLQIRAPKSEARSPERLAAEMVTTLYDESLDAFAPHHWLERFGIFYQDVSGVAQNLFCNQAQSFQYVLGQWDRPLEGVNITYRSFPPELSGNIWRYRVLHRFAAGRIGMVAGDSLTDGGIAQSEGRMAAAAPASALMTNRIGAELELAAAKSAVAFSAGIPAPAQGLAPPPQPDLSQVSARKNLNETAFFYPQLTSDSNGIVRLTFTMPEALTKWRFLGFAHDGNVRSGYLEAHAFTAKDLMIQPNPPRFLREGDTVEFTVKVSNHSDKPQSGQVRLTFNDALQDQSADHLLGNNTPEQSFQIPAKESRTFAWRISVPDGCGFISYKAVAAAANVSDGEEGALPVLSRRILVAESLPLAIRGAGTKKFEFANLVQSGHSKTLQNQGLTVQMVSNPAWYAVLALPYLIEFPYECTEQTFNRLYANALARTIANRDSKIRRIFDQWKNTPALDSPLEKNQDLKAVALEETPWVRQAENESQARRNVGILFDDNRLTYETEATMQKLTEMQLPDGSWPWFPGGPRNEYITLYITTGFGRLRHLNVDVSVAPAIRSLQRLDAWMTEHYEAIQKQEHPEKYVPSATDALYLYGRSFFLKDMAISPQNQQSVEFFLKQARKFWLETNCRQTQGQLALALKRFGNLTSFNDATPIAMIKSLRERSVSNEEMGMFWRDTELSWWWYRAPIETQALMIEAFDEVANDPAAVQDCQVWLLKQKQTQDWKTTKATADAVYALLLRGQDLLSSQALVEVKLGGLDVTPRGAESPKPKAQSRKKSEGEKSESQERPEPGTGFYEVRFSPGEIKPKMGEITVTKPDPGVAWGSVHWQYLEDMSKVTPYEGTPLKLTKTIYAKTATKTGNVLEAVKGPLKVGDELVVRIELRSDRDMEYVHLKDQRGSGTEPMNVLSQYKYQDGLAYYESTRDTASHFFIDYLPKGTYVFEYSTRIQLRGEYQTGVAQIQCMYAPEFNSHSASLPLIVK